MPRATPDTPARLSIALLLAVLLVDLTHRLLGDRLGLVGALLWLGSLAVLGALAAGEIVLMRRSPWTLLAGGLVAAVLVHPAFDVRFLSHEATQEVACALRHLRESPDRGFWSTCLFEYPARQTYLQALPTLVLGPSQAALNVGGLLYFVIGWPLFAGGLVRVLRARGWEGAVADLVSANALILMLHALHVVDTGTRYSMGGYPVALTLMLVGLVLRWESRRDSAILALLALAMYLSTYTYPPVFAPVLGVAAYLGWLTWREPSRSRRLTGLAPGVVVAIALGQSLLFRGDVRLYDPEVARRYPPLPTLVETARRVLLEDAFWTISLEVVVVALAAYAVWTANGVILAGIGWTIVAIAFAVLAKGYFFLGPEWNLHRAAVVHPVLLGLAVVALAALRRPAWPRLLPAVLAVALAWNSYAGVRYAQRFLARKPPDEHLLFIRWLSTGQLSSPAQYVVGYCSEPYVSLRDTMMYFRPRDRVTDHEASCGFRAAAGVAAAYYLEIADGGCTCLSRMLRPRLAAVVTIRERQLRVFEIDR